MSDIRSILRFTHQRYIAYNPSLAKITGSLEAGVLLASMLNAYSLHGQGFYRTMSQILADTGMSEREYRRGSAALKSQGLLHVERRGLPAKNHWYIDEGVLVGKFCEVVDSSLDDGVPTSLDDGVQTGLDDGVQTKKNNKKKEKEEQQCALDLGGDVVSEPDQPSDDGFDQFWDEYPKKEDKKRARKLWASLPKKHKDAALADICGSRGRYKAWPGDKSQYIPNPCTYLNREKWDDDDRYPRAQGQSVISQFSMGGML